MSKEEEYLDFYSFKRINEFKKIAEKEGTPIDEARKNYKSIPHYIGSKIGIQENEAKELHIELTERIVQINTEEIEKINDVFNLYANSRKEGFGDFKIFYDWYKNQNLEQNGKCFYCGIEEHMVASLFEKGFLESKRDRGLHLEIEKLNPDNGYSKDNCVLSCYFCNNDKSDIFDENEYPKFFQNRKGYLEELYKNNIINKK